MHRHPLLSLPWLVIYKYDFILLPKKEQYVMLHSHNKGKGDCMKKHIVLVLVLVCMFFVFSCSTSEKAVFDESISIEDSAWIVQGGVGDIVGYNGISVDWNLGFTGAARIPAGDTLLEWNVNSAIGNSRYRGNSLLIQYKFQPEKKYIFVLARGGDGSYGLNVYRFVFEDEIPASFSALEDYFVGFTPFLNTSERTVLD